MTRESQPLEGGERAFQEGGQLVQRLKGESVPGLFEEEEGRTDARRVGDKQGSSTSRCGQGARGHHVIPISQREEFFLFEAFEAFLAGRDKNLIYDFRTPHQLYTWRIEFSRAQMESGRPFGRLS